MINQDYLDTATSLAQEFAKTAIERDKKGGTPKQERDRLRNSGLLKLAIPQEYGGFGQSWTTIFRISRELAKTDSSIAHVFSYHHLGITIPHIFGSPEQKEKFYTQSIAHNWFWCNALNPLDRRSTLTKHGNIFLLNGTKSFCSGSKDSDILPITAVDRDTSELTVLAIPTQRTGITIQDDWDNMGQRQTDSGSIIFDNVEVFPIEIFGCRTDSSQPFRTIRACLSQLNLANIYLGIAQGAFAAAKDYTQTNSRPWLTSGVNSPDADPYILQHYGNMWIDLESVTCLVDKAGEILQASWAREWELTEAERGKCAIAISVAKAAATKVGLDITSRIFEVMGARATASKYGFDRYWRNMRTFTLHDSLDYKIKSIGEWALIDRLPTPSFYI